MPREHLRTCLKSLSSTTRTRTEISFQSGTMTNGNSSSLPTNKRTKINMMLSNSSSLRAQKKRKGSLINHLQSFRILWNPFLFNNQWHSNLLNSSNQIYHCSSKSAKRNLERSTSMPLSYSRLSRKKTLWPRMTCHRARDLYLTKHNCRSQ